MTAASAPMRTPELRERLQRHYIKPGAPLPGGIFLPEVGWNGKTGGGCDAIYVGFTSTSGRILIGHELKISRADWLAELNKPGKADGWADQCHEWWLVVSDPAIVHEGELPAGWGLMSPGVSKTRMNVITKAGRKTNHTPSWDAVRSIMGRQDTLRAKAIGDIQLKANDEARRNIDKTVEDRVARLQRDNPDAEELRRRLKLLEDALGEPVDFGNQRWGTLKLEELATMAQAAKRYGTLKNAVKRLANNYEIASLRRTFDQVQRDIDAFVDTANVEPLPPSPFEPTS